MTTELTDLKSYLDANGWTTSESTHDSHICVLISFSDREIRIHHDSSRFYVNMFRGDVCKCGAGLPLDMPHADIASQLSEWQSLMLGDTF